MKRLITKEVREAVEFGTDSFILSDNELLKAYKEGVLVLHIPAHRSEKLKVVVHYDRIELQNEKGFYLAVIKDLDTFEVQEYQ